MVRRVTLFLEKEGMKEEYTFTLGLNGAPSALRQIKRYIRGGWKIVNAKGDAEISDWIKEQVRSYNENPDKYKVPIKQTVKLGTSIVNPKGKISVRKVLKKTVKHSFKSKAQKIRDKFRKKKRKLEKENE